jgi:hypothetical protein
MWKCDCKESKKDMKVENDICMHCGHYAYFANKVEKKIDKVDYYDNIVLHITLDDRR